ncbi:alpha/beta-hydrolase [Atractiella rhizophila]|nr:alpha/beta-hydrolase [Atractiella rhizophila]
MSLCRHCLSGFVHVGTTIGHIETINGLACYLSSPNVAVSPKEKTLLLLPDVFGIEHINNQLLADNFARKGWKVVVPDYFDGRPIPQEEFNSGTFDVGAWLKDGHGEEETSALLEKVLSGLKSQGVEKYVAVGYCFGGKYVSYLAQKHTSSLRAGAFCHASLLDFPTEPQALQATGLPLLFVTAEEQKPIGPEQRKLLDDTFAGAQNYSRKHYDGPHGFAVRGDFNDPKQLKNIKDAFDDVLKWFDKYA